MAVGYTRIARQIAFTTAVKSPEIFEQILQNFGVLAALGLNKRVKIVRGGNRFDERIHIAENSTFGHRSRVTQIPTDYQNNWDTAYYGHAVLSGSAVVNLVEVDENQAEHKIDDYAAGVLDDALKTAPNKVNEALMASSPTTTDPESIVNVIEATAFGSQTSTTGGIARSTYASDPGAWQNQYNTDAVSDLGAAAGIATMSKFLWKCSHGSAINEQPDIFLTTTGVFAKATGGGDANRRYGVNDKMLKLGFDNIMINRAAFIADKNVTAQYGYALNTNYLQLQILGGPKTRRFGNVKAIGDGKESISLQVRPPIESDDYLTYVIKIYLVYNLTFSGLRQHGLKTNITEA